MYGIVYMTECIDQSCPDYGMKYIGQHKTPTTEDDGYLGSGLWLSRAISKYGAKSFRRRVLYTAESPEELDLLEEYAIYLSGASSDVGYYNLTDKASGWSYLNESYKLGFRKRVSGMSGKHHTPEWRQRQSQWCLENPQFTRHNSPNRGAPGKSRNISEENRRLAGVRLREWCCSHPHPCLGKSLSADHKDHISKSQVSRSAEISRSISIRNTGRVWVTNGVSNKFVNEQDIPSGYHLGRVVTNEGKVGLRFITNGVCNKQIHSTDDVPEGWYYGITRSHKGVNINED